LNAISTAPAAIRKIPSQPLSDGRSPKNTMNSATSTTLNLSIGANRVAGPSFSGANQGREVGIDVLDADLGEDRGQRREHC
jgi:hypothetical protein